jgi:glycosyltransferase involved in cell wall biosynthesis
VRLLVVSNLYPPDVEGGYERACAHAVGDLRERGHEVSVLTSVPRTWAPPEPGVLRTLRVANIFDPALGNPPEAGARAHLAVAAEWVDAGNVYRLLDALESARPEVVYVWNVEGLGGLGLLLALQLLGVPWVMQLEDPIPGIVAALRGPRFPQTQRLFLDPLRGRYISVSRHVVEEIRRNGVELAGPVAVLPNWVSGQRPAPRAWRRDGPLRIMTASVVTRFKGIEVMLQAAARLRDRGHDDFTLDVYGPVLEHDLYGLPHQLGLSDRVTIHGELSQPRLLETYAEHDLLAFPTWRREAFGLTGLEATARGCPVLMTDGCGLSEWLVDGVHCLKAERTPEAFAGAIERVLGGEVDLAAIAARGQRMALDDLHADAVVPRVERELAAAAAEPRGRGRSPEHVYRTAVLAENLATAIIDEAIARV